MESNDCLVSRLFYFTEDGVADVDDPNLAEVMAALATLDGVGIETFSVKLHNGDSIDVGGGKDDQYKCHARTRGRFFDLLNPSCPIDVADAVSIMMNDEGNAFPKCCIVPFDLVEKAVSNFCSTGNLHPDLKWDDTLEYEPL